MIEDTSDKVRRNLVTYSSAVIAIWIFNPKVKDTIDFLGIATIEKLSGIHAWLLALIVLIYLFARYRFDDASKEQMAALQTEFIGFQTKSVEPRIRALMRETIQEQPHGRGAPRLIVDKPMPADFYAKAKEIKDLRVNISFRTMMAVRARGEVYINFAGMKPDGQAYSESCEGVYIFPWYMASITCLIPAARTSIFSKGAVDVMVPFALFSSAMVVCVAKLALSSIAAS